MSCLIRGEKQQQCLYGLWLGCLLIACNQVPVEPLSQQTQEIVLPDANVSGHTPEQVASSGNGPSGGRLPNTSDWFGEPRMGMETVDVRSIAEGSGMLALVRVVAQLPNVTELAPAGFGPSVMVRSRLIRWRVDVLRFEGTADPLPASLELYFPLLTEWVDDSGRVVFSSSRSANPLTDLGDGYGERRLVVGQERLVLLASVTKAHGKPLAGSWDPVVDLPKLLDLGTPSASVSVDWVFLRFVEGRRFANAQRELRRQTFETLGPGRFPRSDNGRGL